MNIDFSGLISGLSASTSTGTGAAGSLNLGGLTGLGSVGSSGGGGLAGLLSSAGGGAAAGSVGGPLGIGIGAALGVLTSLINKHGEPDHERPDLNAIAAANDITAEQASWVCGFEESKVDDNYDTICARAARDKSYFQQLVAKYNASHPNEPVVARGQQLTQQYAQLQSQVAQKFGAASPLANVSLADAQAAAAAQGATLPDYLNARITAAGTTGTVGAGDNDPATLGSSRTLLYVGSGVAVLLLVLVMVLIFKK